MSRNFGHNSNGNRGQSSYRGQRGGGNRFGNRNKSTINIDQLIKKANPDQQVDKYEVTKTFGDFDLPENLLRAIESQGFEKPTPIQEKTIPVIDSGRDVMGIAHTGTGKTAAFIIPLLKKLQRNDREKVLVIAPTRELALQIEKEMLSLARFMRVSSAMCIGGTSVRRNIYSLEKRFSFLIGTPGRIKDLAQRGYIHFNDFSTVVLDEVDRMLDMGFVNEITEMMRALPQDKQSIFFSATTTRKIDELVMNFAKNPVIVSLKTQSTAHNVDQDVVRVTGGMSKREVLEELLSSVELTKVIIFGRTKRGVRDLSIHLREKGHRVTDIHGNKTQSQREMSLRAFSQNRATILVATDVAARGIDVPDVSHVINYDMPDNYTDYIHRIGRTGRAGKKGTALTFV
jgi:ATP-dependent RNA helicase RhlE